jgi:hypothetical protein
MILSMGAHPFMGQFMPMCLFRFFIHVKVVPTCRVQAI